MVNVKVMLDDGAYMPEKAHKEDAGFDLRIPDVPAFRAGFTLYPGCSMTVDTGIHMLIQEGFCGLLVSKSGLNVKGGMTSTGLVDAGYTGSITVKVYNHGKDTHYFKVKDKVSQIMILPVPEVALEPADQLEDTDRGDNGFGSSGR